MNTLLEYTFAIKTINTVFLKCFQKVYFIQYFKSVLQSCIIKVYCVYFFSV